MTQTLREEIQLRYGHQVLEQYDDQNPANTRFVLQALDEAPEALHKEAKRSLDRHVKEFQRAVRAHAKEGATITWKTVGNFKTLALALTAAKMRVSLAQYDEEGRAALVASLTDPQPVKQPIKPAPESTPATTLQPTAKAKKATKKSTKPDDPNPPE